MRRIHLFRGLRVFTCSLIIIIETKSVKCTQFSLNCPYDIIEVTNILSLGKLSSILKTSAHAGDRMKICFVELCWNLWDECEGRIAAKVIFSTWRRVGGKSIIEVDLVGGARARQFSLFYISIRDVPGTPTVGDMCFRFHGRKFHGCCADERRNVSFRDLLDGRGQFY